jgi:hypothetical protein
MVLHQPLVQVPSRPSNTTNSLALDAQRIHFVIHDQTTFVTHERAPFPKFIIDAKEIQL